jgi:AraC family transcriptional regulator, regulatory protein of adaptative response / methylated-DNA-[protein]-cysteine methyltransferase
VEAAIRFLEANFRRQPRLEEIARSVHLSKYHFQRLFTRWAGVSPTQFLHFLTLDYAKEKLAESRSLLETSFDAGLSGSGRLHDLFVTMEAVTPGQFKGKGAGVEIRYGVHPTPFGPCVLARTSRGICHLSFAQDQETKRALTTLESIWPRAALTEDGDASGELVDRIFASGHQGPVHLHVPGTNFQVNVWRALLTIPSGAMVSYQDMAGCLGRPGSARPVGNAIAANPVAYLIPCHRVITKSGKIHRYHWGTVRKKAMLGWEAAHAER